MSNSCILCLFAAFYIVTYRSYARNLLGLSIDHSAISYSVLSNQNYRQNSKIMCSEFCYTNFVGHSVHKMSVVNKEVMFQHV